MVLPESKTHWFAGMVMTGADLLMPVLNIENSSFYD